MEECTVLWSGTSFTLLELLYNYLVFSADPPAQISKEDLLRMYWETPLFQPMKRPDKRSVIRQALTVMLVTSTKVAVTVGFIVMLISLIASDVYTKIEYSRVMKLVQAEQCQFDYTANKCDLATRTPAVVEYCIEKELCMNQDSSALTLHLGAQLLSEILQSLIAPLDYKTISVVLVVYLG